MVLERDFQKNLIKEIKNRFPGAEVLKTDASQKQGIPDLLILHNDKWAMLEVKRGRNAKRQPNQDYYVDKFNHMSFARVVSPENKCEVLDAIQQAFGA